MNVIERGNYKVLDRRSTTQLQVITNVEQRAERYGKATKKTLTSMVKGVGSGAKFVGGSAATGAKNVFGAIKGFVKGLKS